MKKMMAIVISVIIIITIILIILLTTQKDNIQNETGLLEGKSDIIIISDVQTIEYADNRTNSFIVKQLAEEYINYVVGEKKDELINIISNKYIQEENITTNNIIEKLKDVNIQYNENYKLIITNLYVVKESISLESYFVNLLYCNLNNKKNYEIKLIIQLDLQNSTFDVIPYRYMQKLGYDKLKIGDSCKIELTSIIKNQNNIYKMTPISKNSTAERYFNIFLDYLKYDKQKSYDLLNIQYKEKRFNNVNEYIKYINDNNLQTVRLKSYKVYTYNDYTQYVCIDNEDRYFIFNEKGIMNFEAILDTYTIDLPKFIEEYEVATDENKVLLNIQKCFEAINNKDYSYVYNKLDETFKFNNFKTLVDFEKYMNSNFFIKNKISANNLKKQNDIYLYDIKISNNEGTKSITKTFVMQLKQGTDFIMSFGV